MKKNLLKVQHRKLDGLSNKKLRKKGLIPGVIYSQDMDSIPIEISSVDLSSFLKTGEKIFSVEVQGKGNYIVGLDGVDRDATGKSILHVSLHRLKEGQKAHITVPLIIKGKPKGAKKGGVLNQLASEVHLLTTPEQAPEVFELDVSDLGLHEQWTMKDLTPPEGVEFRRADLSLAVVSCSSSKTEVQTQQKQPEEKPQATPPEGESKDALRSAS